MGSDLAPFYGGLSLSEKPSEFKPFFFKKGEEEYKTSKMKLKAWREKYTGTNTFSPDGYAS